MAARSLFETEILPYTLRQALGHLKAEPKTIEIIERELEVKTADELGKAVLQILREIHPENIEVGTTEPPAKSLDRLASRITNYRDQNGRPRRMDFIKIKDASLTLGISLATLAISIATLSPSWVGSALNGIKGIHDNWVTLQGGQDDDAMSAYDALLRHTAEVIADCIPRQNYDRPCLTAADLQEFGGPAPETSLQALKRLKELGLAEVVHWNGSAGDVDNPANQWAHRA